MATDGLIEMNSNMYSTVVIWDDHIGSYGNQAPLLGTYLRKDLVNWGTLG